MRMRGSALCCQSSVRLGGGYPSSRCSQISARVPVVSACEAGIECQKAATSAAPPIFAVRGKELDGGPGRGACVSHQGWRGPARQAIGGGGRAWLPGGERRAGNTCLRHIGMGRRGRLGVAPAEGGAVGSLEGWLRVSQGTQACRGGGSSGAVAAGR